MSAKTNISTTPTKSKRGRATKAVTTDTRIVPAVADGSDRPDYRRPEYKAADYARDLCARFMGGTQAVKAAGEALLPRWPGEKPKYYKIRASICQVARYYERTVQAAVGMICATPPKLADEADVLIVQDCDDIDGQGTHLEVFLKDLAVDAVNGGFAAILVDAPTVPAGIELTSADVDILGLRPFWARITADRIPSWIVESPNWAALVQSYVRGELSSDQVKGYARQSILRQVVICEPTDVTASTFGIATLERYRVLRLTDTGVTFAVWEKRAADLDEDIGEHFVRIDAGVMEGANQQPFREIPLAIVYAGRRRAPFVADPAFLAQAELNLDHYQVSADRRYLMKLCHAPTLFLAGFDLNADDGTGTASAIEVGPNSLIASPDVNAKASFVCAPSDALNSSKEEKEELVRQMAALGMSFLAKDRTGGTETATGRELDDAAENSSHATIARGLQDGAEQALKYHAHYRGVAAPGITINTTYASPDVDPQLAAVIFQAVAQDRLPIEVLIEYLKTGQLPEQIDLDGMNELRLLKQQLQAASARDALASTGTRAEGQDLASPERIAA